MTPEQRRQAVERIWLDAEKRMAEIISGAEQKIAAVEGVEPLDVTIKREVLKAVAQCNGNVIKAAGLLGVGKTTAYRYLRGYKAEGSKKVQP